MRRKTTKGFTLIELLVVIAIIALLSSVVLVSLSASRSRARDSSRVSELQSLQKALASYFLVNGRYPRGNSPTDPSGVWKNSGEADWQTSTLATELNSYYPDLPVDPINSSASDRSAYNYTYLSFGTNYYLLVFNLENAAAELELRETDGLDYDCDGIIDYEYANVINWGGRGC